HVFAGVVADAFHDRQRAGIPDREAFAGDAPEIGFAADRAVEDHVTGDDVLSRLATELGRGLHGDAPAAESLAAIVVGVADVVERYALRQERAEALPGGAREADVDGVIRQPVVPVALGNLVREHRPDGAIDIAHGRLDRYLFAALERGLRELDQTIVERLFQSVVLRLAVMARHLRRHLRLLEDL